MLELLKFGFLYPSIQYSLLLADILCLCNSAKPLPFLELDLYFGVFVIFTPSSMTLVCLTPTWAQMSQYQDLFKCALSPLVNCGCFLSTWTMLSTIRSLFSSFQKIVPQHLSPISLLLFLAPITHHVRRKRGLLCHQSKDVGKKR